jgi:hypothetical protein
VATPTTWWVLPAGDGWRTVTWLNNLPAGSITSWADLSQAFSSNFQATYNHPGNAFNLGRVTVKPNERLHDYTNRFFENRNRCQGRPGCCQVKEGCQGSQDL